MNDNSLVDNYCSLAMATVKLAREDYKTAIRLLNKKSLNLRRREELEVVKKDCERFFRTGWIHALADFDGEELIESLRKEALESE